MADWASQEYAWLDRDSIFMTRLGGRDIRAFALNTKTGAARDLAALNKRFTTHEDGRDTQHVYWLRVTPDGKWLLWAGGGFTGGAEMWFAATVDGSKWYEGDAFGIPGQPTGVLTKDRKHWLMVQSMYSPPEAMVTVVPLLEGRRLRSHEHHTLAKRSKILEPSSSRKLGAPLGMNREGRVICPLTEVWKAKARVEFVSFEPESPGRNPRVWSIRIPSGAEVWDVVMNPRRDVLAWHLSFKSTRPRNRNATIEEIWVSQLDGKDMRPIGYISNESLDPHRVWPGPYKLKWILDGNRLSFIYRERLYAFAMR